MIRRLLRIGLLLGLIGGIAFALTKLRTGQNRDAPAPPTLPPEPWPRLEGESTKVWVEAIDGVCPTTHPVKAKLGSKIFHLPGMSSYGRTNPDRCYADATAAEADGLRVAKR